MSAIMIPSSRNDISIGKKSSMSVTDGIFTLGPYDILFGRNKSAIHNIGNRRFRVTIGLYLQAYLAAKTKREKSRLIRSIVNMLQVDTGARFLKATQGGGYVEMDEERVHDKVGRALRDLAVSRHQSTMTEWTKQLNKQEKEQEVASQQADSEVPIEAPSAPIAVPCVPKSLSCQLEVTSLESKRRSSRRVSFQSEHEPLPLEDFDQNDEIQVIKGWFHDRDSDDRFAETSLDCILSNMSRAIDETCFLISDDGGRVSPFETC